MENEITTQVDYNEEIPIESLTCIERQLRLAKAEYLNSIETCLLDELAVSHSIPYDVLKEIFERENWKMQKIAYDKESAEQINAKLERRFAVETENSISRLSTIFDAMSKSLEENIKDGKYIPTVNELNNIAKTMSELGSRATSSGKSNNDGPNFGSNNMIQINFNKPIEQMTLEEAKEAQKQISKAVKQNGR